jgi:hypothetical protein
MNHPFCVCGHTPLIHARVSDHTRHVLRRSSPNPRSGRDTLLSYLSVRLQWTTPFKRCSRIAADHKNSRVCSRTLLGALVPYRGFLEGGYIHGL